MSTMTLEEMHTDTFLQFWTDTEVRRLRQCLDGLNPLLEPLIYAAAAAYARYCVAMDAWSYKPDDLWLKVARDSLKDYQRTLRLLLKHSNHVETARRVATRRVKRPGDGAGVSPAPVRPGRPS